MRVSILLSLLAVLTAAAVPSARSSEARGAPSLREGLVTAPAVQDKLPRIDSGLARLGRIANAASSAAAAREARRALEPVEGTRVRVQLVIARGRLSAARAVLARAGGRLTQSYADLADALVPPASLTSLTRGAAILYVSTLDRPHPLQTPGEGVGAANAAAWQTAGFAGAGVTVAVIDGGYKGLRDRQLAGDLPTDVDTGGDFCAAGDYDGSHAIEHGTAVAEIVHEVAPAARLLLLCEDGLTSLGRAKDYAIAHGAAVINYSAGYYNTSRGDGSGGADTPEGIAADARAKGVLWVSAAGNRLSSTGAERSRTRRTMGS